MDNSHAVEIKSHSLYILQLQWVPQTEGGGAEEPDASSVMVSLMPEPWQHFSLDSITTNGQIIFTQQWWSETNRQVVRSEALEFITASSSSSDTIYTPPPPPPPPRAGGLGPSAETPPCECLIFFEASAWRGRQIFQYEAWISRVTDKVRGRLCVRVTYRLK